MNRCRPYRLVHPLRGCGDTRGNALGYRYVSPDGDGWSVVATAAHFLAQSSSDHCSQLTAHWTYTFSAKEKDSETGLSYFGSRYYSSDLSIWLSVDPMSDKYASLSPYNYCANNPIKLVDPNGEEVVAEDMQSQKNITYSLSIREARYVRFDKNGVLDNKRLQKCKSNSNNITALKALSKSDTKYRFSVGSKDKLGESFYRESNNHYIGVAHMPGGTDKPSPDLDVHIVTWDQLDAVDQVKNLAHEAYGHAYFYELKQQGVDVNPYHTYENELDEDGICCKLVKSNEKLESQISVVTREAVINYTSRR